MWKCAFNRAWKLIFDNQKYRAIKKFRKKYFVISFICFCSNYTVDIYGHAFQLKQINLQQVVFSTFMFCQKNCRCLELNHEPLASERNALPDEPQ